MCFPHGKYRGSGCKPRGLEDVTEREKSQLTPPGCAHLPYLYEQRSKNIPLSQNMFLMFLCLKLICV